MKRYLIAAIILSSLVAVTLWGNRVLGRILDDQLPPLLTRELGLPVRLAPIKAHLPTLTAKTARLEMGEPGSLAVAATDVSVSLAWTDLLRREIRLINASGAELMLKLSNWPGDDDPWPDNYHFLDPWLPRTLKVASARYVDPEDSAYEVSDARWERLASGGASLAWSRSINGQQREYSAALDSLDQLLALRDIQLDLGLQVADEQDSEVAIETRLEAAEDSGYMAYLRLETAGLEAHITASSRDNWRFPEQSKTSITSVEVDKLRAVVSAYSSARQGANASDRASPDPNLPALDLPEHRGRVDIEKVAVGDEFVINNSLVFSMGEAGLAISELTSHGPKGILHGRFSLRDSEDGWTVDLDANLQAREEELGLGKEYLGADWSWHTGQARLSSSGASVDALLNALEGDIDLAGFHRGEVDTPFKLKATLDKDPDRTYLDYMEITLGEGRIVGSASLYARHDRRVFKLDIVGERMDLGFLLADSDQAPEAGIAIPAYLASFPGIDLDWTINLSGLRTPGFSISRALIDLVRSPDGGKLKLLATGLTGGTASLQLFADRQQDESSKVTLNAKLVDLDLSRLFQQGDLLHSRTTGSIDFSAQGKGLPAIFRAMEGTAELSTHFRRHDDWDRPSRPEEQLALSGDARLVIAKERILGVEIDNLDIDSIRQDINGRLSLVAERDPWLVADLNANQLDISGFIDLLPESTAQADRGDLLNDLRDLGAASISLTSASASYKENTISDLAFEVSSGAQSFAIEQLDFTYDGNPLRSRGGLAWQDEKAVFTATARIDQFDLDRFLLRDPAIEHVPVSGSLELASEGEKFTRLIANLNGRLKLSGVHPQALTDPGLRREVDVKIKRLPDGLHADVERFQWGENELAGSLRYRDDTRDRFEISIDAGTVSLALWEAQQDKIDKGTGDAGKSRLAGVANASARLVNDILAAPGRLFSGPGEAEPGDKLFDDEPLPFGALNNYDADIEARLDRVNSRAGTIEGLELSATLEQGRLDMDTKASAYNSGPAELHLTLNAGQSPPPISLEASFTNTRGSSGEPTFPRSGFVSLTSSGNSTAELASNLDGQVYLELGKGPYDYANVSLLTSDMAARVAKSLIPGIEKTEPRLECGIALATFESGVGTTPVGYTLRTDQANLIGRVEVDLNKEMIEIAMDSRSREGVGLAVGNVFSNTIRIKGPMTDPQIVPHTTGLLWRGWAAFMTAGLSVLGESVIKRALAAENPCKSLKKDIRKNACGANGPLTRSPLVCGGSSG